MGDFGLGQVNRNTIIMWIYNVFLFPPFFSKILKHFYHFADSSQN